MFLYKKQNYYSGFSNFFANSQDPHFPSCFLGQIAILRALQTGTDE